MELFHARGLRILPSSGNLSQAFSRIRELSSTGRWKEVFYFYKEIKKAAAQPIDHAIFSHVLKACLALASLRLGKSIHSSLIKEGFDSFSSVGNSMMDFYAKSGELRSAFGVFNSMNVKDSISWNIILQGNLSQGAFEEGLDLFIQARVVGFDPNISNLLLIIQAYRSLRAFDVGMKFHGYLIKSGLWSLTSLQNSLLNLYTDIGMEYAENLFDEMLERDVISWSVIIRGYVQSDESLFALETYKHMLSDFASEADGQTMVIVIKACTNLGDITKGKVIHGFVIVRGLDYDFFVGNSLIDFYSKCQDIDSAVKAFNEMPYRNLVSWNSLLSGFVHNQKYSEAFTLLSLMGDSGLDPDEVTLVSLLQACKFLGDVHKCKSIHSRVIQKCFESNQLAMNSLIDAYAKCNQINHAWKIFRLVKKPNIVTWSTMISGFTHCGMPDEAISIYHEMRLSLQSPTPVTLLSLIEACALSSDIRRAKWAHGVATRMELASDVVIGTAILDMYSKCGDIEASKKAFDNIFSKNIVSWSAIIAAYGLNGLPHETISLFSKMKVIGLKPNSVTILSLLSACCHGGMIKEGLSIFEEMVENNRAELKSEHYSCLVDLLARSGNLGNAMDMINSIPVGMKPSASAWGAVLSASRNYENREFSANALSRVLELEPLNSSGYLLASSLYAAGGSWNEASGMRSVVKERGVKVVPGYSLVYVNNKAYSFTAGDKNHQLSHMLSPVIAHLHSCMKMDMGVIYLVP